MTKTLTCSVEANYSYSSYVIVSVITDVFVLSVLSVTTIETVDLELSVDTNLYSDFSSYLLTSTSLMFLVLTLVVVSWFCKTCKTSLVSGWVDLNYSMFVDF